ncbi:hypothetical protein BDK88_0640 [Natrinema hispanicum]|uniref:Uncharacterized protein n=1 Tax=Natrinema hispanicum TaxID=392421 RepID=A0A482YFP3_9EURY|nr:hypothetical protein BDK88_0640 [Natrinema hispanicum]
MGIYPPDPCRVLGNGRLESIAAYKILDIYFGCHDPEAETLLS